MTSEIVTIEIHNALRHLWDENCGNGATVSYKSSRDSETANSHASGLWGSFTWSDIEHDFLYSLGWDVVWWKKGQNFLHCWDPCVCRKKRRQAVSARKLFTAWSNSRSCICNWISYNLEHCHQASCRSKNGLLNLSHMYLIRIIDRIWRENLFLSAQNWLLPTVN